jgi:predicted enzyme related to lactoylglutathione lyase
MDIDKTIGAISWMDLTVPDAENVRDFYKNVVGWKTMDISMGEYNDYCMISPDDNVVRTGVCHARGANAEIPPAWILYVNVADLDASMEAVRNGGGTIINGPRKMGEKARYCLVKDPAGAYVGLYDHGEE